MCTRNELNLILQAMTQAYQAVYGANVVKIILYGSYARGDYQKDSDIDIVVIVIVIAIVIRSRGLYSRYCTGR